MRRCTCFNTERVLTDEHNITVRRRLVEQTPRVHDRYAMCAVMCALTGTAFSIICEFRESVGFVPSFRSRAPLFFPLLMPDSVVRFPLFLFLFSLFAPPPLPSFSLTFSPSHSQEALLSVFDISSNKGSTRRSACRHSARALLCRSLVLGDPAPVARPRR